MAAVAISWGGAQTIRCPLLVRGRKLLGGASCSWGGRRGRQGRGLERCITRRGTSTVREDGGGLGYKKKEKKVSFDDVLTCSAMDVHVVALFSLLVSSLCRLYRPLHEGV
jgi:hypothetical protein